MVSPNSSSVFFLHFGGKEGREGAWLDKGKLREIKGTLNTFSDISMLL